MRPIPFKNLKCSPSTQHSSQLPSPLPTPTPALTPTSTNIPVSQYQVSTAQTNAVTNPTAVQQSARSNSFTISGNTLSGQYAAMQDRGCPNDWLMIPCASNAGRQPNAQIVCVDRLCGGAFNAEASINSTSVIST